MAPHLSIYKLDQTWLGTSAINRVTGIILSGGMYLYAGVYVIAPLAGWHLESMSLAAVAAATPFAIKAGIKTMLGGTFAFHFFNSIRHLMWDAGVGFGKQNIARGTWFVWGLTAVGALYLGLVL